MREEADESSPQVRLEPDALQAISELSDGSLGSLVVFRQFREESRPPESVLRGYVSCSLP